MSDTIFEKLVWLDEASSPFGMRCLDCRLFSQSMLSTTDNQSIAARFGELRNSNGKNHTEEHSSHMQKIECNLSYPHNGQSKDGPLFLAQVMEDKWDVYLYDNFLYFARSWSGDLVFKARIDFTSSHSSIVLIDADMQIFSGDAKYVIRQVDFLIKSHLYKREVPHPLPPDLPCEVQPIVLYSFSKYGRWASFAAYEDTTQISIT